MRPGRARALLAALVAGGLLVACGTGGTAGGTGSSARRSTVPGGAPVRAATAPRGTQHTITVEAGGLTRTAHLYVPRSLPSGAVPLLVALHGGLGSGTQFEQDSGFDGLAEANRFLVVYPDGTSTGLGSRHLVWNAGGCCGRAEAGRDGVDDVGFVRALVRRLESRYDVDRRRVYVTGHSNGAMLAYAVACQAAATVDAVAVQAGALMEPSCRPSRPVSVMEIHGTDDQNVPIGGGRGSRAVSGTTFPPPVRALETFARRDGCGASSTGPDRRNRAVTVRTWRACRAGSGVEWVTVAGANHAWMGHPGTAASRLVVGRPFMGFDSSAAVWSFLAAHPGPAPR